MKRVAFIIQHLTNGGAERTISNLSLMLKDKVELYLIIFDGSNITYPYEGTLLDLKLPPVEGQAGKLGNSIKRILAVRKLKKQYKFDCVISFMFGANIVNTLSGKCGKTITSARNYMSAYGKGLYRKFRERFIGKRSDQVIALSKMVKYDLESTFGLSPSKVKTIYNPCDISRIKRLAQEKCEFQFDKGCFYFVNAGRMVEQKGQWHLIKAFSEVRKKFNNARLIILGSGELEQKLKKLASDLNVEDSVSFFGFVSNPYTYISKCNCFVLSSLFEGLGNVIIEAMACGVPVISYDCLAGPRELIAPETCIQQRASKIEKCSCGMLVPLNDETVDWSKQTTKDDLLLADAMQIIINSPVSEIEMMTQKAIERLDEFNNDNIIQLWMDAIEN